MSSFLRGSCVSGCGKLEAKEINLINIYMEIVVIDGTVLPLYLILPMFRVKYPLPTNSACVSFCGGSLGRKLY